jgi:hypothetical protein
VIVNERGSRTDFADATDPTAKVVGLFIQTSRSGWEVAAVNPTTLDERCLIKLIPQDSDIVCSAHREFTHRPLGAAPVPVMSRFAPRHRSRGEFAPSSTPGAAMWFP